jgi:hypothetical protein
MQEWKIKGDKKHEKTTKIRESSRLITVFHK